jgi:hypothetical protein
VNFGEWQGVFSQTEIRERSGEEFCRGSQRDFFAIKENGNFILESGPAAVRCPGHR